MYLENVEKHMQLLHWIFNSVLVLILTKWEKSKNKLLCIASFLSYLFYFSIKKYRVPHRSWKLLKMKLVLVRTKRKNKKKLCHKIFLTETEKQFAVRLFNVIYFFFIANLIVFLLFELLSGIGQWDQIKR